MPKQRPARESDDPAPVRETGTTVLETGTVPQWLLPYRGKRRLIFMERGPGAIHELYDVFAGSAATIAEFTGLGRSTISGHFSRAGLKAVKRDPWGPAFDQFADGINLDEAESIYRRHTKRRELAREFTLEPAFGEKGDRYAHVIWAGDLHIGHDDCDWDRFCALCDWLAERPQIGLVGMGDLFDLACVNSPGIGPEGVSFPFPTFYAMVKRRLEPLRPQIIALLTGNHERRLARLAKVGVDPIRDLARELGIAFLGYCGWLRLHVGKQTYLTYAHHGAGSGQTKGSIWNTLARMAVNNEGAELVCMGHRHHLGSDVTSTREGPDKQREVPLVCTGSFLASRSTGYAAEMNLSPAVLGAASVFFYADRHSIHPRT
jgi:hypothetical protein